MATIQMVPPSPSPYGHWPDPSGPAPSTASSFQPATPGQPQPYPYPPPYSRWPFRPVTLGRGLGIAGGIMLLIGGGLIMVAAFIYLMWWFRGAFLGMLDVAAFILCVAGAISAFRRWHRPLALFAPGFLIFASIMSMGLLEELGLICLPFACISLALMLMGFSEMRPDRPGQEAPAQVPAVASYGAAAPPFDSQAAPSPYGQWPYPMAGYPQAPSPFAPPAPHPASRRRMYGIAGVVLVLVAAGFVTFFGFFNMFWMFADWAGLILLAVLYFSSVTAAIVSAVAVLTRTHRGLAVLGPVMVLISLVATMFEFDFFTVFLVPIAALSLVFVVLGLPAMRSDRPVGWTVAEPSAAPRPSEGVTPDAARPPSDVATTDWTSR